jgi:8-oxo-dGDP phosphatase
MTHPAATPAAPPWRRLSGRVTHHSRWFDVCVDEVIRPDGERDAYHYVRSPGAVTVLAIDSNERVLFTRQWIYTHGETQWRLPSGAIDPADADPHAAAVRELAEETGYTAASLTPLTRIHGADSLTNHVDHLFLARDLTPGPAHPSPGEADLTHTWLPHAEALTLVRTGQVPHAPSAHALLLTAQPPHP